MAYFIIETEEQLANLAPEEDAYVEVLVGNDNYHPKLTFPIAVYYRTKEKGYILPVNHSETFNLTLDSIKEFLGRHHNIYCLDKKHFSYFFPNRVPDLMANARIFDIGLIIMDEENKMPDFDINPQAYKEYYKKYYQRPDINRIIPIVKLFERSENLYEQIKKYVGKHYHYDGQILTDVYKRVEEQGISIDEKIFNKHFEVNSSLYSIKDGKIYTSYNLYNLTSRPTNAFNNVNFLAINKDDNSRRSFIPTNDMLIELDFEAYHLKLIANLLGEYQDSTESIHTLLAREYYQKEDITEEEYKEAKELSFKLIYGGIPEDYLHIPFFKKIVEMQEDLWLTYKANNGRFLPTGRWLKESDNLYPQKLFNYYIQNLETSSNIHLLSDILDMLENYKTKVILVVYDSLLLDFSLEDGKEPIQKVKQIIENHKLTAKFKYGKNYHSFEKLNFL